MKNLTHKANKEIHKDTKRNNSKYLLTQNAGGISEHDMKGRSNKINYGERCSCENLKVLQGKIYHNEHNDDNRQSGKCIDNTQKR